MRGNVITAAAALVFAVLSITSVAVFDTVAVTWVRDFHKSWSPTYVFYYFTMVPIIQFFGGGTTVAAAGFLFLIVGRVFSNSFYRPAIAIIMAYAVSGIIAQSLKHLLGRARPRITEEVLFIGPTMRGGFDAFPSGHTTVVFCIAIVLSRLYPRAAPVFFLYALVIACERVVSFTHFPGDVLAGIAVGVATAVFVVSPLLESRPIKNMMCRLVPGYCVPDGDESMTLKKEG